jgi:glycosyltransferase involved in cell wall biosynthesis
MPSRPSVSVVVPNYNHASFLEERLQSIFDQTLQDFELVYLDDASTDDSAAVFAKFRDDPRVSAYESTVNGGNTFRQWNRGVERSRGEFVWIAESDDSAAPELLEGLVGALERHPKAGLAYCQSWRIDSEGRRKEPGEHYTDDLDRARWRHDFFNSGTDECARYLTIKNTIPNASAVVFRRSVYEEMGGAPEDLRYTGDWITWIRMLMRSDICFVAQHWNFFRKHGGTVRNRAVLEGIWAEEGYKVLEYIAGQVDVPAACRARALSNFAGNWVDSATTPDTRMSEADHRRIYELASRLDPGLFRRVLRPLWPTRWPAYLRFLAMLRGFATSAPA